MIGAAVYFLVHRMNSGSSAYTFLAVLARMANEAIDIQGHEELALNDSKLYRRLSGP